MGAAAHERRKLFFKYGAAGAADEWGKVDHRARRLGLHARVRRARACDEAEERAGRRSLLSCLLSNRLANVLSLPLLSKLLAGFPLLSKVCRLIARPCQQNASQVALTLLGGVIVAATLHSQLKMPAPYGRHAQGHPELPAWGRQVHQRTAHILSDFPPGVLLFIGAFLGWGLGSRFGPPGPINWVLFGLWLLHYVHRGLLHPLLMRYSSRTTALGIPLAGALPLVLVA